MQGIKVAYLLGSLNRGGTETLLLDVFNNSQNQQLNAVGIYRKSGVLEKNFIESGVPMIKLSPRKNILIYIWHLRKLFKNNSIDIVHAQQPIDALYAYFATIGTKIPLLLTLHGYDFNQGKHLALLLKFILPRTNKNLYVSENQCSYYSQKYNLERNKQIVVYNGISFNKMDSFEKHSIRKELGLDESTILIGSVGNFNEVRDQFTLCHLARLLSEQNIDFHLIFAGKRVDNISERYDNCVDYCKEHNLLSHVHFLGSRQDVPNILSQLNAFIYASDHDTFGIAVVEAMAVGVPVFVNDWEVMTEITEDGKLATLYITKDENDLVEKFKLFLQNKEEYKQKALKAASYVRQKYSIEKHIDQLKELCQCLKYVDRSKSKTL